VIGISSAKARQPSGNDRQSRNHGDVDDKRRDEQASGETRRWIQSQESEYRRQKAEGKKQKTEKEEKSGGKPTFLTTR